MAKPALSILRKEAFGRLVRLEADSIAYRTSMERIFHLKLSRPRDCRKYFGELLLALAQLYLDCLMVKTDMPVLWACSRDVVEETLRRRSADLTHYVPRDRTLSGKFTDRLRSRSCWSSFAPGKSPYAALVRLENIQDYFEAFGVHLPEIHHDTLSTESQAKTFRSTPAQGTLSALQVGLDHITLEHIGLVQPAVEWASDKTTWSD